MTEIAKLSTMKRRTLHYNRDVKYEDGKLVQSGKSVTISCLGNCNECAIRFMCFTSKNKYDSLDLNEWQWKSVSKL